MRKSHSITFTTKDFWRIFHGGQSFIVWLIVLFSVVNLLLFGSLLGQILSINSTVLSFEGPTLPQLLILTPAKNQTLEGVVPVTLAYKNGNGGFTQIAISVDGKVETRLNPQEPYEVAYQLDTNKFTNGEHILSFKATDSAGRSQTAQLVVNFKNGPATR